MFSPPTPKVYYLWCIPLMHDQAKSSTTQLIATLWQRNQPQVLERLDLLDRAAEASGSGTLTLDLQQQAAAIAHIFAGSLGMFGFFEGTQKARELELHLESPTVDSQALANLSTQLRHSIFPTATIE